MDKKENKIEQKALNFSAIMPYIEENMPEIVEVTDGRGDWEIGRASCRERV